MVCKEIAVNMHLFLDTYGIARGVLNTVSHHASNSVVFLLMWDP